MSSGQAVYRVLAIHEQAEHIEAIMNQLRNNGYAVKASIISEFKAFLNELSEQSWDLLLAQHDLEGLTLETAAEQIKKLNKDIPMMALVDEHRSRQTAEIMALGFCAVLPMTDLDGYFYMVIGRELTQLRERRRLRKAEVGVDEVEKRCEILLESSRDAIAYVADGMHILVNSVYVELFGYQEVEEVYAMPLMDMVASESQADFKKAFKKMQSGDIGSAPLSMTCLKADDSTFSVRMSFTEAHYQGEACLQLLIRTASGDDSVITDKMQELSKLDVATGLFNRYAFEQELSSVVQKAVKNDLSYALFYLKLDQYNKMRAKIGVEGIDLVCREMAGLLKGAAPEGCMLARFAEDVYVLLWQEHNVEKVSRLAQSLSDKVENHLFEMEPQALQFTACVGVALISEKAQSAHSIIARAQQASAVVSEKQGGSGFHVFDKAEDGLEETEKTGAVSALDLQKAFDKNLFKILFQPIINLRGSTTQFYEVLLRRVSEDGAFESPEPFLKSAEAAKVASIVDRWVIIQSVKALMVHAAQGNDTKILINLTKQSLLDKNFIPWLGVALKTTRMRPGSVIFQINQEDTLACMQRVHALSEALNGLSCHLSVSRLSSQRDAENIMSHVDLGYVKLDGLFTKNNHNSDVQKELDVLISSAHEREIKSIATQVECPSVLSALWQVGVHYIQGYYLQPPMEEMDYDFTQDDDAENE